MSARHRGPTWTPTSIERERRERAAWLRLVVRVLVVDALTIAAWVVLAAGVATVWTAARIEDVIEDTGR